MQILSTINFHQSPTQKCSLRCRSTGHAPKLVIYYSCGVSKSMLLSFFLIISSYDSYIKCHNSSQNIEYHLYFNKNWNQGTQSPLVPKRGKERTTKTSLVCSVHVCTCSWNIQGLQSLPSKDFLEQNRSCLQTGLWRLKYLQKLSFNRITKGSDRQTRSLYLCFPILNHPKIQWMLTRNKQYACDIRETIK